ncbi:MAG TPA: hypothetical protein VMB25_06145 [Bryobacteraceae bacterium]|nr:hypothetical protein [Bryobacteraceae bacterium]
MAGNGARPHRPSDGKRRQRDSRKERIHALLTKIEHRLDLDEGKVTLADFIRLTQLERELEQEEQPREIIVTWKDSAEQRDGSK